jgi:pimeloyl-ACP methyl ester carboxylesterase
MLSYDMPLATTKHGTLHYDVIDQVAPWRERRKAILFHHGIGACAEIWAGWRPALVDGYRLVSFDMRGCGRSDIPAADFAWSLDLLVEDLFAVADAAGLKQFHLVGESIGGTVALAAALARPERIATLTVSNGAHLGASIQRVEAWRRQLDTGGVKAWSDAFLVRQATGNVAARVDPECTARADWRRSVEPAAGYKVPDPVAASRRQPVHPGAGHG